MQYAGFVIFTVLGMGLIGGLSLAMYSAWPQSMLERASRHGRFCSLGSPDQAVDSGTGKARAAAIDVLQGNSV